MNRKLVGGVVAALALAVVAYFAWFRTSHAPPDPAATGGSAEHATGPTLAARTGSGTDARGLALAWTLDPDPDGPLRLEGQVVDRDGNGVGGAEVWITTSPPRQATTDDSGGFAFDKLIGKSFELSARSKTGVGNAEYKLTPHSDPVIIRLSEGSRATIHVRDEAGQPIAHAQVSAEQHGAEAQTDDRGTATLAPLDIGFVTISARAQGFAPASTFVSLGTAGAVGDATITLRAGVAVSGRVIDDNRQPIANVRVREAGMRRELGANIDALQAITDAHGEFTIAAIARGTHTLTAVDGEHQAATDVPITVGDHPVTGIEIKLKAGGVVAGKVVDKAGAPVAYATVHVRGAGRRELGRGNRTTTTDVHGGFELHGLTRAKLSVRAESDEAASKPTEVDLEARGEVRDVSLVLDVTGTISGVVVDAQGAPVPEVSVHAFADVLGNGGAGAGDYASGFSTTTTDGAGAFTVTGLADGAYRLWAQRASGEATNDFRHGVTAHVGDRDVKLVMKPTGSLIGTLKIDGQDAPPFAATVDVGTVPTPVLDGAFALNDITAGTYDLRFRGAEFAQFVQHGVVVEPDKVTDLGTIVVFRGRALTGTVVDSNATPVAGARVKLGLIMISMAEEDPNMNFDSLMGTKSAVTDQNGNFTIVGVPAKETNVIADHPDKGRSLAVPVPLTDGDPPPMTLALRGFGSVVGTVTAKGQPVAGAMVSETAQEGAAQAMMARTAADGTFAMAKVPEGAHTFNAMQSGGMMAAKSASAVATVVAGQQTTVTIDFPAGVVSLKVNVKPLPGNVVNAAQVCLLHGNVQATNAKQLSDGFFQAGMVGMTFWLGPLSNVEFDELVAGAYTLCTVPITGNMMDPSFQASLQENMGSLKVYCQAVSVAASPALQQVESDVPAMVPLPGGGSGAGAGSGSSSGSGTITK